MFYLWELHFGVGLHVKLEANKSSIEVNSLLISFNLHGSVHVFDGELPCLVGVQLEGINYVSS